MSIRLLMVLLWIALVLGCGAQRISGRSAFLGDCERSLCAESTLDKHGRVTTSKIMDFYDDRSSGPQAKVFVYGHPSVAEVKDLLDALRQQKHLAVNEKVGYIWKLSENTYEVHTVLRTVKAIRENNNWDIRRIGLKTTSTVTNAHGSAQVDFTKPQEIELSE